MDNNPQENNNDPSRRRDTPPWEQLRRKPFFDGVLKDEFIDRKLHLKDGETWMRILPRQDHSAFEWMFPVNAVDYEGGRFAHPNTLHYNAVSVFDHAAKWIRQCYPHVLYSKTNKNGIRLFPRQLGVCWVIVPENGKSRLRLLLASAFRGGRSGPPGLAHQLWQASIATNEDGTPAHNFVDPQEGTLVCVRKKTIHGHAPLYHVVPGRIPAPLSVGLEALDDSELRHWCPLENTIEPVTEDREWRYLSRTINTTTVSIIKQSLKRGWL